jgi:3-oxoacyl-[acyl-carrier-protein] synthase-3
MHYNNIIIKNISIYHPLRKVTNDEIILHFKNQNLEIEGLLNHLGREIRYKADDSETSLSMAENVACKVIASSNIQAEDIGLLFYVSDTPEYLVPTNSLRLHNILGTINAHINMDINANCIGMLAALDNAQIYLRTKNIKYGLVIGSVLLSNIAQPNDTVAFGTFGDGACAILLENINSDKEFGFIGSNYFTDSSLSEMIQYPICGVSSIANEDVKYLEKKLRFTPHDVSFFSDKWKELIINMLNMHNININNIQHYLFSQFSKAEIKDTLDKLGIPFKRTTFVGDKYGYTGCTSPIFALKEAIDNNSISLNEYIVFCSVGAGYNMCSLLYKNMEV